MEDVKLHKHVYITTEVHLSGDFLFKIILKCLCFSDVEVDMMPTIYAESA